VAALLLIFFYTALPDVSMSKLRLSLLGAVVLVASSVLGATVANAQATSTLAKVKASGVIPFGYREASFGFQGAGRSGRHRHDEVG
jgi:hypothetical protein